ncbi:MAG: hypothetical protein WC755_05510 [Candidatus Woesearchaeota archaeon]|jgi:NOL1/NOP2/fmu family ribosome biogenesis protein
MKYEFLNSKEKKKIIEFLKTRFGYSGKDDFHLIKENDEIFLFSSDLDNVDINKLKVRQIGMKIGTYNGDMLILTIQGTQYFGPKCHKHIINLSDLDARHYLKGEDIDFEEPDGVYLIKNDDNLLGCSKIYNGIVRNNIEDSRQINCKD